MSEASMIHSITLGALIQWSAAMLAETVYNQL